MISQWAIVHLLIVPLLPFGNPNCLLLTAQRFLQDLQPHQLPCSLLKIIITATTTFIIKVTIFITNITKMTAVIRSIIITNINTASLSSLSLYHHYRNGIGFHACFAPSTKTFNFILV
jgi:hypothetical protein